MFRRLAVIAFCGLGFGLAACGGGGKAPMLPSAPAPTASASQNTAKSTASFVIVVPRATPAPSGAHRPLYISPATQSLTLAVMQGSTTVTTQTDSLTAGSSNCASSLANVTCTVKLSLNPGSYTVSITTYDGASGHGNQLSTAQDIAFTVAANANNIVPLSLSGIPATIIATAGNTANTVYVVAEDADGNYIIGSGAPTFTATKASGSTVATITQPSATAPNTISFALASPAPAPGTETIGVTASYPSGQTNGCLSQSACTLATPITAAYAGGTAFLANYDEGNVLGYTLPLTSSTQAPSYSINLSDPFPLTTDTNGNVFAATYGSGDGIVEISPPYSSITASVTQGGDDPYGIAVAPNGAVVLANTGGGAFDVYSPPYNSAPVVNSTETFGGLYGAAADSKNNIYVGSETYSSVYGFASPYNGAPFATVSATSSVYSLLASGSYLFVGGGSYVDVFSLPLTNGATPAVITSGIADVYGMAVDPQGHLWVANYEGGSHSAGSIEEFTSLTAGATPSVTINMPVGSGSTSYYPWTLGFDSAGNLYVANIEGGSEEGGLLEFTTPISSSSTPAVAIETSILYYPYFLSVVGKSSFKVTP